MYRLATLILVSGILSTSACADPSRAADLDPPRATWVAAFPDVAPATLRELADILNAPEGDQPATLDIDELPAAVFCLGCENPDLGHEEWNGLIDRLCGPDQLAHLAISKGWGVHVIGYIDDAGPHGPGTENARLPLARAEASAAAIRNACSIPASSIETFDGGISANNVRKIVVAFHRSSTEQELSEP